MEEIALVYMVAGMSSRFGGKVKQFARVGPNNETLIEYSLNQALKAGFTKIVFIVGEKTEKGFKEMFGENYKGVPVYYAYQSFDKEKRDRPWGSVDALCSAKDLINCKFVVCNGDDIYGEESFEILFKHLQNKNTCATLGYKLLAVLPEKGEVNRGVFEVKNNKIKSIKEILGISLDNFRTKNLSEDSLISMNIFALNPEVLNKLCKIVEEFKIKNKDDRRIECLLPQELGNLIKNDKLEMSIYSTNENWFGLTNPEDEEIVRNQLKK